MVGTLPSPGYFILQLVEIKGWNPPSLRLGRYLRERLRKFDSTGVIEEIGLERERVDDLRGQERRGEDERWESIDDWES